MGTVGWVGGWGGSCLRQSAKVGEGGRGGEGQGVEGSQGGGSQGKAGDGGAPRKGMVEKGQAWSKAWRGSGREGGS